MEEKNSNPNGSDLELLSFRLGAQEYCVDIMSVREIRGWTTCTPLPFSPRHVKGVINLRGTVLPVVELSVRLGMESCGDADNSVIIVVEHRGALSGLLVDAVSDILSLSTDEMQAPPDLGGEASPKYVSGLFLQDAKLIRVLNLDAVLPSEVAEAS